MVYITINDKYVCYNPKKEIYLSDIKQLAKRFKYPDLFVKEYILDKLKFTPKTEYWLNITRNINKIIIRFI